MRSGFCVLRSSPSASTTCDNYYSPRQSTLSAAEGRNPMFNSRSKNNERPSVRFQQELKTSAASLAKRGNRPDSSREEVLACLRGLYIHSTFTVAVKGGLIFGSLSAPESSNGLYLRSLTESLTKFEGSDAVAAFGTKMRFASFKKITRLLRTIPQTHAHSS